MYAQVEKPKENKSRAVANSVAQKKSNGRQIFGFVDNRAGYLAQRKSIARANVIPHARGMSSFSKSNEASAGVVQRQLEDDLSVPAVELAAVDGFLQNNDFDPDLYTPTDYITLQANHALLVALNGTPAASVEQYGQTAIEVMYDKHFNLANVQELRVDNEGNFNAQAAAGAVNYEANTAAGYPAAAATTWPGRGTVPPYFVQSIQTEVAALAAARGAAIDQAYDAYKDGRLLPWRIGEIRQANGGANLAAVQNVLAAEYTAQCIVSRNRWIPHLGIQGQNNNTKGGPGNGLHYTTFNNAVSTPGPGQGGGSLSVEGANVDGLSATLFATVNQQGRVHATLPVANVRHHRYWGDAVNATPALSVEQRDQLNTKYDEMVTFLKGRVKLAIDSHGRLKN